MKSIFILVLTCLAFLCGCVAQSDLYDLDDRLTALEKRLLASNRQRVQINSRIEEYNKSQEEREQDLRDQSAVFYATIERLKDEMQAIDGQLEETGYLLKRNTDALENGDKKLEKRLDRMDENLNFLQERVSRLEQYLNLEPTDKKKLGAKSSKTPEKVLSEEKVYHLAKQAYDQGDFETARQGFQQLIQRYPKSKNADNAQFWIGEIYYREKWYEKAIIEYQKVIENYPKGNKVTASLLKQGLAFFNLGDKANSRLILNELISKYPKSNEAKIAKQKLKQTK